MYSGSLRAVLASAADGDVIQFNLPPGAQSIALTGGELLLSKSLTINGPAAKPCPEMSAT